MKAVRPDVLSRAADRVAHEPDARPKIEAEHLGYTFRAIGNQLVYTKQKQTFHEFLIDRVKLAVGKKWYFEELAKPADERHQIVQWCVAYSEFTHARTQDGNRVGDVWESEASGPVRSLVTLGHDIYLMQHSGHHLGRLVQRLRDRHEFQGARYELAVAAMFVRLGYQVTFRHEKSKVHCEFTAKHPNWPQPVAVEAKSRRRPGVLHQAGDYDPERSERGDIGRLVGEAVAQAPGDIPFLIFIDLNAKPTPGVPTLDKPWVQDIKQMLERHGTPGPHSPDAYTAMAVTNFAYHYGDNRDAAPDSETLFIMSQFPKHRLPEEFLAHIWEALKRYGLMPE